MDNEILTGVVLSSADAGEYDRRLKILTGDRGIITAFARGARRQNSKLLSAATPFTFGRFSVVESGSFYRLAEADVINYFDSLKHDLSSVTYASYILELSEYFSRENVEANELIRLIYQSFRALGAESVPDPLVRRVFEIRLLINEGIYPGVEETGHSADLIKTVSHVESAPLESLYTFRVSREVQEELSDFCDRLIRRFTDRPMKS
ncbi:MAG: DNA repair protein RecO, partial [Lachnospiraceae bacterium]|nr:DNA repair protein RecO [Lachnospiraceae bacterium]